MLCIEDWWPHRANKSRCCARSQMVFQQEEVGAINDDTVIEGYSEGYCIRVTAGIDGH